MLIESKIRRLAGTRVTLGAIAYHFMPDALGRHVADVEDVEHLTRFLSISEGFCVAAPLAAAAGQPVPAQPAPLPLVATEAPPPVAPPEPVSAPPTSAIPVAVIVDEEDGQREGQPDDGAADEDGGNGEGAEEVDAETAKQALRDELATEYKALFGRKPAYNKTVESMARDIAERKAADAKAAG